MLKYKYKYIFQIKYTEAILSDSTRKLLWFEIAKMLIEVFFKVNIIYYNFRHTFVPFLATIPVFIGRSNGASAHHCGAVRRRTLRMRMIGVLIVRRLG